MGWTTTDLLTRVRLYARLQDDDVDYTDAALLMIADDLISSRFSEVVASLRQGHWLHSTDVALVSGTKDYRLPKRALAEAVTDVLRVDSAGNVFELAGPLAVADVDLWRSNMTGTPEAFGVLDNVVRVIPTPSGSGDYLRIRYPLRRSKLVLVSAAGLITNINTGTRVITCSNVPATFSTSTPLDLLQAQPGFATLAIDVTPTAVVTGASGTVTLPVGGLPADLAVGDYLALAWQTPVLPLPEELHGALAKLVGSDVLAQTGAIQGAEMLDQHGGAQIDSATRMLTPRVRARPEKIRPRSTLFRRGGGYFG